MTLRLPLSIGLDLDNTIICYDNAFTVAAKEAGLIPADFTGSKQQVCDYVRALPGGQGETEWQKLQGHVYGAGIQNAALFPGVTAFLEHARTSGIPVYIISHKTQFGHFDAARVNLHEAAKTFLESREIFSYLPQNHVFFCLTRSEKLHRITALGCEIFVDDLEEIFTDQEFPQGVRKVLFTTQPHDPGHFEICSDWSQIKQRVFDAA